MSNGAHRLRKVGRNLGFALVIAGATLVVDRALLFPAHPALAQQKPPNPIPPPNGGNPPGGLVSAQDHLKAALDALKEMDRRLDILLKRGNVSGISPGQVVIIADLKRNCISYFTPTIYGHSFDVWYINFRHLDRLLEDAATDMAYSDPAEALEKLKVAKKFKEELEKWVKDAAKPGNPPAGKPNALPPPPQRLIDALRQMDQKLDILLNDPTQLQRVDKSKVDNMITEIIRLKRACIKDYFGIGIGVYGCDFSFWYFGFKELDELLDGAATDMRNDDSDGAIEKLKKAKKLKEKLEKALKDAPKPK